MLKKPSDWKGTEKQWLEFQMECEIKRAGGSPNAKVYIDEQDRPWFYYGGFILGEIKWPTREPESGGSE